VSPATDDALAREGKRPLSVAHFLVALGLLLVAVPFLESRDNGRLIEAVLFSVVFLSAVPAVGGRRRTMVLALVLGAPALAATWARHLWPDRITDLLADGPAAVFVTFVIAHLLLFILRAPWVNAEVLCAAIATYLMMALLWAFAYTIVARLVPDAFRLPLDPGPARPLTRFEALYFSFETLTTVDYGDIVPASNASRLLAMMEATTGVFYMAVLIARLVSHYSGRQPRRLAPAAPENANAT
jgi:hypothetical protein